MRKIIGNGWNGLAPSDHWHFKEQLSIDDDGIFYLYGKGGPASKYGERFGGGYISREMTKKITKEEALKWCKEYLTIYDEYEKYFID